MAQVFLDTNFFIDLVGGRSNKVATMDLDQQQVYISPLSVHILFYVERKKVPNLIANVTISQFKLISLTTDITEKSLEGPTNDLEDNIQLHSAADADCDYFLTNDKKLLRLGYFGKTKIANSLPSFRPAGPELSR